MSTRNQEQYAMKILGQIMEMFQEDCVNHVNLNDLAGNQEKLKDFIHSLLNVAPSMAYNKITGSKNNWLEVNHTANQLCFEFMAKEES